MQRSFLVLAVGLSVLSGCSLGDYRVVRVAQGSGEVALQGLPSDARPKADAYMAGMCPGGYDIVEESEAVVGQADSSKTETRTDKRGRQHSRTTGQSQDLREWRIKYVCKAEGAATEKAAAPAAAPATAPATAVKTSQVHELVIRL